MRKFAIAAAVAAATISSAAMALVTFDSTTGAGFVGKGDVQLAFGWNNAAAQRNAGAVTFQYESSNEYETVCVWTTGNRNPTVHRNTNTRSTSVSSTVAADLKKTGQYTGYYLTGFGATTTTGEVPYVGGPCPGFEGNGKTVESVTDLGGTGGGLFVTYNGVSVQIG